MNPPLLLTAGPLRCEIVPELGACIAGLWLGDVPVLRSPGAGGLTSARLSGNYPLVPFSNRISQATLTWNGTSHPLVKNFGDEPHAIHGVGWQRPWSVLDASEQFAWPFAFDTSQAFRLTADALELSLSITNQSAKPTPVGLGWHPYFVKRAHSHVSFEATGRWEMDTLKLPTHRTPSLGLDVDCAGLEIDNCFDGWRGEVHLRDETLHTRVASKLKNLVVFTNDRQNTIAIEPVSHVNNEVDLLARGVATAEALGIQVLQPGESMTCKMGIQVRALANK